MKLTTWYVIAGSSLAITLLIGTTACSVAQNPQPTIADSNAKQLPPPTGSYPQLKISPIDQVNAASEFGQFRTQLKQAVKNRDAKYIRSIAAPDILLTFGRRFGLDRLKIDDPKAPFWQELEKSLAVGCVKKRIEASEIISCPFSSGLWSELIDRAGGQGRIAIIGNNIPVYARPSTKSPTIATLSNEAIKLADNNQQLAFVSSLAKVLLPSGQTGYVSNRYIYTRFGYRAIFQKLEGKWQMRAFVAGD
jgi:hypothetical protein